MIRRAAAFAALLLLAACSTNGGGSPPTPPIPPAPPPAPTKAEWVARYDLPGLSTNCSQGDSGQQGFSCGRMVESLVTMFRATGERVYLDKAVVNIDASLAKSEECAFDGYPVGTRCWTSKRYSPDEGPYLLHDGWWWLATLGFVAAAKDHPDAGLRAKAASYLAEFEHGWRTRWDADYRPGAFVLSVWQEHYAGIKPGWSLPHNMTATWTLALHRYGAIVGRPDQRVAVIAARFKAVLIPRGAGVVWRYADKLLPTDPDNTARYASISDSDHAATNAFVIVELAKGGVVFTASDIAKVAYTFRTFVAPGGYLKHYIDGTGLPDGTEVGGWAALPGVGAHVAALLDRPGNPYGSERLAVAHSALNAPE